jgi:hypothetical protein
MTASLIVNSGSSNRGSWVKEFIPTTNRRAVMVQVMTLFLMENSAIFIE